MSQAFEIRRWWGEVDDGSDSFGDRERIEAFDAEHAAERFMETRNPLSDWLEGESNEIELLVRKAGDPSSDQRIDVVVDFEPVFRAQCARPLRTDR